MKMHTQKHEHRRLARACAWLGAVSVLAMAPCASATGNLPPPTVTITAPVNQATFTAPANLTLLATASSPNGAIKWVQFYNGTVYLGMATQAPFAVAWKNVAAGSYTIVAKANDATETGALSAPVTIKVTGSGGGSSPPPPPSNVHTVTVVNGTISGTNNTSANVASGNVVNITATAPPVGQVFQHWSANAPLANSFSPSTSFTMPAANVVATAGFYTPAPVPQPVATHPRLWLTPADLPKLQGWAIATNPIYQQGLKPLLNAAVVTYNTQFFPNGVPNANWPDLGDTQGYQGLLTEQYVLLFAFNSLIDPSPSARIAHAQRARNLIMVAMNQAAQGALSGAPFRDPLFSVYNRANFASECWPLVVDWIYHAVDASQQPILTTADKATIRTVFLRWANECLNASTTGGDHPSPIGVTNSTALVPGGAYRMAANNYYL